MSSFKFLIKDIYKNAFKAIVCLGIYSKYLNQYQGLIISKQLLPINKHLFGFKNKPFH